MKWYIKHRVMLLYAIFGLLTTVVNWIVYLPLFYLADFTAVLSNGIAWFCAVLFAFVTNKQFVFKSTDWNLRIIFSEFFRFIGCRILSGIIETVILLVSVDLLQWNGFIWKIVADSMVVILNYIGSKLFVFKNDC